MARGKVVIGESASDQIAVATFVRNWLATGRSVDDLITAIRAVANEMPGKGQSQSVQQDHEPVACARQPDPPIPHEGHAMIVQQDLSKYAGVRDSVSPMPGEGQNLFAPKGHGIDASARQPLASGKGQRFSAQQGHIALAPPARVPDKPQRKNADKSARARAIGRQFARTVFDQYTVPDGRNIGEVRVSELKRLAVGSLFMTALYVKLANHARTQHMRTDPLVNEAASERQFQAFVAEIQSDIEKQKRADGRHGILISPDGGISVVMPRPEISPPM